MKVVSSIGETTVNTTTPPTKDVDEIIDIICKWNGITRSRFNEIVGPYTHIGTDINGDAIFTQNGVLANPIGIYLMNTYDGKDIVFEKGNDKFFGRLRVRSASGMRYQLGESIIEIPYEIRAVNEDTMEGITIFPKTSDILQSRMKPLYVVNTGRAERQRLEKEIIAKMVELAMIRGGSEIISTQDMISELKQNLNKRGIDLVLDNGINYDIRLKFPRRKIRDTATNDREYIAPPIIVSINFEDRAVQCKGYSSHGFGTPSSWGNPCWGNWDNEIKACLRDCSFKGLVNLIISWAYGYNSEDTGRSHDGRHPLAKLRDYAWWAYERRNDDSDEIKQAIQGIKEHMTDIKADLNIDDWLDGCSGVKEFISSLEGNEKSE